ncbi:uncharacterized protein LOC142169660 [Nicotiana tabacum]|uniref:Uncharacterized protein LOC142169660 n=1 Tax=Nicotiana tabacum TaxID=4097 RepID=A0AC58SRS2_TOBAC
MNKYEFPIGKKKDKQRSNEETEENKYMSDLPFPPRQRREKVDKQFGHMQVNLHFTEFFSQMPTYSKFLKEILSKKRKVVETSVLLLILCLCLFSRTLREIGPIRCIPVSLQLADQTTVILEGTVEDVLVRVDTFAFPMDFIVVNIKENKEVPQILGRPFLATGREVLDIHEGELMLRVGEERVVFNNNNDPVKSQ